MRAYTETELQWIKDHVSECKHNFELTEKFNKEFELKRTHQAIASLKRRICPDHIYPHSGGVEKGKGFSVTARPIGSERKVGGYTYIKVGSKPISKDYTTKEIRENWVQKQRYIYEQHYGKIPPKHHIVFLDGNTNNFDITNLYCISMKAQTVMMRNGWFSDNPDITLTAIKYCELQDALKGERREDEVCSTT